MERVGRPEPRLDPAYGWPLRDGAAPGDEDRSQVPEALAQELLDWGRSWRERTDDDGSFADEAAESEHLHRGRALQQRLRRELDRPVVLQA